MKSSQWSGRWALIIKQPAMSSIMKLWPIKTIVKVKVPIWGRVSCLAQGWLWAVFLLKDASSVFIISTDTMNSQLHQCQELLRDYNLDVLPALYATLDEDIFIARPSFCCHHSLVFIISFGSHPAFFLLFFFFLLRSIQIARVAMGKWQNIDLMVSATCVAGSVLSPRLFFLFWFLFFIPRQRRYRSLLQHFP